jgi:predicted DNA repair protein MutK
VEATVHTAQRPLLLLSALLLLGTPRGVTEHHWTTVEGERHIRLIHLVYAIGLHAVLVGIDAAGCVSGASSRAAVSDPLGRVLAGKPQTLRPGGHTHVMTDSMLHIV